MRWFRQGARDGETAGRNTRNQDYEVACFLYQQGSEKLLKAVLYLHGERSVFGHSTLALSAKCAAFGPEFGGLQEACSELDAFYIPTRYPNGVPDGVPFEFFGAAQAERAADAYQRVSLAVSPYFDFR